MARTNWGEECSDTKGKFISGGRKAVLKSTARHWVPRAHLSSRSGLSEMPSRKQKINRAEHTAGLRRAGRLECEEHAGKTLPSGMSVACLRQAVHSRTLPGSPGETPAWRAVMGKGAGTQGGPCRLCQRQGRSCCASATDWASACWSTSSQLSLRLRS